MLGHCNPGGLFELSNLLLYLLVPKTRSDVSPWPEDFPYLEASQPSHKGEDS